MNGQRSNTVPRRALSRWLATSVLLLCLPATPPALAATDAFEPVDGAAEQLRSRRYQVDDSRRLLLASLAVLQDIRFMVLESATDPGLLVAQSPVSALCECRRNLTVSVQPEAAHPGSYLVRLSTDAPASGAAWWLAWQGSSAIDDTAFYQDFFTHLDRELFRERQP